MYHSTLYGPGIKERQVRKEKLNFFHCISSSPRGQKNAAEIVVLRSEKEMAVRNSKTTLRMHLVSL